MDPALQELIETGEASEDVAIVVRMREPGSPPPGLRIISRFGPIATARITRSAITQIYGHPDMLSVKAPRWLASEYGPIIEASDAEDLELRDTDLRRPPGIAETGKGCIIGIIDWGCDFAHPDFLTDDGRTRFLAIWDQRTTRHDGNRFGYGRIHHADAIQAALKAHDPYRMLDYHPAVSDTGIGAHGTHVMSIAAGNGRSGGPEGIAPEAQLLFVHLGVPGWDRAGPLGDSSNLLEALDFMVEMAGDRPLAINMSLGRHGGPHDGSTLVELAIDWLLNMRPGLAIVQSAGNYFGRDAHSSGRLRSNSSVTVPFHVNPGDTSPNEVEVWYRGCDVMAVKLIAPSGSIAAEAALASKCPVMAGDQRSGTLYHRIADSNNGDNHIHLFQYPNSQAGEWQMVLTGIDVSDGRFDSWIERDPGCRSCQARFDRASVERTGTTGSIAHSLRSLVVGAYDRHRAEPALAPFSSSGPTRDGRVRPLLLAPGVKVLAARSQSRRGDAPLLTRMSGTSMASPHVAGTCALIFEAAGALPVTQLRTLLLDSLSPFSAGDERDRNRTGFGLLDIEAALAAALGKPALETTFTDSLETEETAMSCIPGKTCCGRCKGLDVECDAEKRGPNFGLCCTRKAGATGAAAKKCCGACNKAKRVAVLIEAAVPAESAIHPVDAAESVFMASPADAAEFVSAALAGAGRRWPEGATAASLFDAILGRLGGDRQAAYARHFGIIGRPGAALAVPVAAGDVLIRRGDGSFAHSALIAHPHLLPADAARAQGLVLEGPWPGQYVQIIEHGHRPHRSSAKFARRICGPNGHVLGDTLILRPLPFSEAAEVDAEASATDAANMRWLQSSLNQVINAGLTVDGKDGPATRAAIRRFQQSRKLTADGIAGERTRAALRAALGEGPQPVSPPPGGIVVDGTTCRNLDRFGFDSATLTPEHTAAIATLARTIASANVRAITVTGHASPEGPDDHNVALGQRRADNVAAALRTAIDQQRAGASAAIAFTVTSRGEAQPVGSDGPANRRAEICFREEPRVVPPPPPRTQPPHANCLLPAQGLRLRPDVDTPEGRRMLTRYERAVGLMKAAAEGPPHNWIFQWYTHNVRADRTKTAELGRVYRSGSATSRALANEMWDTCAAHFGRDSRFFLPWHRMYVEFLEQLCRGVLNDNDFMLPYWNYSKGGTSGSLPAAFRNSRSPLFNPRRAAEARRNVNRGDPIDGPAGLDPTPHLRETSFLPGPGNVPNGFSRGLDRGLHGNVHTQIGIFPSDGSDPPPAFDTGMGSVPWAANDAIFWMHHCNIDRLWASWNRGGGRNPSDQPWLAQTFIFADRNGRRVVARTGDFVSTDARGYSYDCLEPMPAGATRLAQAGEEEAESTGPAIAVSAGRGEGRGIALGKGATRVRLGTGEASEAVAGDTITPRSGRRLYLVLRNYRADSPPGTVYRVYLELPANATPEIARRHYVGTFNFFDAVPHHGGAAAPGQTFSFDITDLARRLAPHGGISRTPNVTIVPAGRAIEAARPVIGEISIVER